MHVHEKAVRAPDVRHAAELTKVAAATYGVRVALLRRLKVLFRWIQQATFFDLFHLLYRRSVVKRDPTVVVEPPREIFGGAAALVSDLSLRRPAVCREQQDRGKAADAHALDLVASRIDFRDLQRRHVPQLLREVSVSRFELSAMTAPRRVEVHEHVDARTIYGFQECVTHKDRHWTREIFSCWHGFAHAPLVQRAFLVRVSEIYDVGDCDPLHRQPELFRGCGM
mmetsp:Transcript_42575/g.112347  ORF Transcript_42575/g.112347 Transcript_42575/m.112347 type:complete len:225 (+) Transcript_42575:73-747(+)